MASCAANKHIRSLYATSEHREVERDSAPDHLHRVPRARRGSCRSRRPNPAEERSVLAPGRRSGHRAARRARGAGRRARRPTNVPSPGARCASGATTTRGAPAHDSTPETLQYTLMGGQAGAPVVEHVVDMTLLDPLLADAEKRPDGDAQIQNTLFELLFPREIKLALADGRIVEPAPRRRRCQLSMGDARQPRRHAGDATQRTTLRPGRIPAPARDASEPAAARTGGQAALVIGNPPARPNGPPLKGACEESGRGRADPARAWLRSDTPHLRRGRYARRRRTGSAPRS